MPKKILVLGGYGRIGRELLRRLRGEPDVQCVLGGRDVVRGSRVASDLGVDFVPLDVTRAASINSALDGAFAAVHVAGPFQWRDQAVASACIRRGAHYLDLADTRSFILGIGALDERARTNGVTVLSGAGINPALSSALVQELAPAFDRIDAIHVSFCAQAPGGPAALQAQLAEAGRPIKRLDSGRWQKVRVGSAMAEVTFSAPLGRCRLYGQDAADLELFPKRFGAATVRCQVSYAPSLMQLLRAIGQLHNLGLLPHPERLAPSLMRVPGSAVSCTGLRVAVHGIKADAALSREIELLAHRDAGLLPLAPVLALLRRWQRGETVPPGARPCMDVPSFSDIKSVLVGSGVLLSIV